MVTFICPTCGHERTGQRRRCYECSPGAAGRVPDHLIEHIRGKLLGVKHSPERRRRNSEARRAQNAAGHRNFDIAAYMRTRPHPFAKPIGHRRIGNGHWQVKCPDGKWRYEHRVVWEAAHGPIPAGMLIHHLNHDPLDNRLDNLEAVTRSEHHRRHAEPERMRDMQARATAARRVSGNH